MLSVLKKLFLALMTAIISALSVHLVLLKGTVHIGFTYRKAQSLICMFTPQA